MNSLRDRPAKIAVIRCVARLEMGLLGDHCPVGGGVQEIARRADANPNTMYRTLSKEGNPSLKTLRAVLKAMGLQLAVRADGAPGIAA